MDPQSAPQAPTTDGNYFSRLFSGRLNRKNYAIASLLSLIVPLLCVAVQMGMTFASTPGLNPAMLDTADPVALQAYSETILNSTNSPIATILLVITTIYFVLFIPFSFSLQIRRLHDLDHSGWLTLLNFVPVIGYIFPLYVTFVSGTDGVNKYGEKPLHRVNIKEDILQLK